MDDFPLNTRSCLWCENPAIGSHGGCYHHDEDFAELRKDRASTAAKSKGNAELRKLKAEVKAVIDEVKAGKRDRNEATAIFQGYRLMRDLVELERRVKETDELAKDLAEIKEML